MWSDLNNYSPSIYKLLDLTILIGHLVLTNQRITRYMHLCDKLKGVPITSFDPLISPCPFTRLDSPFIDIVDNDIENYSAFMRRAKAPFVWLHQSICSLLVKVVWPTQSTYNHLCSNEIPLSKAKKIAINNNECWCTMGYKYWMHAVISRTSQIFARFFALVCIALNISQ